MPSPLESGKIVLTAEEQVVYCPAAAHLRITADMVVDVAAPLTVAEWMFLQVARAVVEGDTELVEFVVAKIDAVQNARKRPQ
jgi:hypothetical protein